MKQALIISLTIITLTIYGQEKKNEVDFNKLTEIVLTEHDIRKRNSFIKSLHIGMGIGPETLLSLFLPKVSLYNFHEYRYFDTYYGIEGTIGILVAQWYSFDCIFGVKKNNFSFDTSIGVFWYPKQKFDAEPAGPYFHSTLNPKIGIKIWNLWFKAGPSIFLYKDHPENQETLGMMNFTKFGNVHYNFEILVNFR